MKKALPWVGAVLLVAAAWGVTKVSPGEQLPYEPFVVTASLGEAAAGRDLHATVTKAQFSDELVSGDDWSARGTWLVLTVDAATVTGTATLSGATLQWNDRTYSATTRAPSLYRSALVADVPRRGMLAFELPPGEVTGPATLRLSLRSDTRLDSVIEVPLQLEGLPRVPSVTLLDSDWAEK